MPSIQFLARQVNDPRDELGFGVRADKFDCKDGTWDPATSVTCSSVDRRATESTVPNDKGPSEPSTETGPPKTLFFYDDFTRSAKVISIFK